MTVHPTDLQDARLIELRTFGDDRGYFFELWNQGRYAATDVNMTFVQTNISFSKKGVLRGMHAQCPTPQGKLVTVMSGRIWDAIVDVRPGSPTYMRWQGFELSAANGHQLWVPPGFLHGFLALEDDSMVGYMVTAPHDPAGEFSVAWDDPEIGIEWPLDQVGERILSPKDASAPIFSLIGHDRLVPYA